MEVSEIFMVFFGLVVSALLTAIIYILKLSKKAIESKVEDLMTLYTINLEELVDVKEKYIEMAEKVHEMSPKVDRNGADIQNLWKKAN